MLQDATSKDLTRENRYRVSRPRLQRIAGWCSLSSAALLLVLIVIVGQGENGQGLRGVAQWFPVGTLYVLGSLGILFVVAIVSAAYWVRLESDSNGFPWHTKRGENRNRPR